MAADARTQVETATDKDNRLQADPEMREGKVGFGRIAMMALAALGVIFLVLYGINTRSTETGTAGPPQGQSSAPGGGKAEVPNTNNVADQPPSAARGGSPAGQR